MEEQWQEREIELFVGFWRRHGRPIAIGVVVALLIAGGYRFWRYQSKMREEHMSSAYARLERDLGHQHDAAARVLAQRILDRYSGSTYAVFAALTLAKLDARDNHWAQAAQHLGAALRQEADPALRPLIRIRLARVLFQEKKPKAVLALLHGHNPGAYAGVTDWLKGRAELHLGHPLHARNDFALALDNLEPGSGLRQLIELKMATLPAAPEKPIHGPPPLPAAHTGEKR